MGISIAELLASVDRALSVLPHDLVAKGWVQVQPWLFLEIFLFLYFAESGLSGIFLSEGDFGSSACTIRHFSRLLIFHEGSTNFGKNLNIKEISIWVFILNFV